LVLKAICIFQQRKGYGICVDSHGAGSNLWKSMELNQADASYRPLCLDLPTVGTIDSEGCGMPG
jgi:hypothetical protein